MKIKTILSLCFFTIAGFLVFSNNANATRGFLTAGLGYTNQNNKSSHYQMYNSQVSVGFMNNYFGHYLSFANSFKNKNTLMNSYEIINVMAFSLNKFEMSLAAGAGLLDVKKTHTDNKYFEIPLTLGLSYYFIPRNSIGLTYKYTETFSDIKINSVMLTYSIYFDKINKYRD